MSDETELISGSNTEDIDKFLANLRTAMLNASSVKISWSASQAKKINPLSLKETMQEDQWTTWIYVTTQKE